MLSVESLSLVLLRTYKARQAAYQVEVLETPRVFGKDWRSDKEARSEFSLLYTTQTSTTHLFTTSIEPET